MKGPGKPEGAPTVAEVEAIAAIEDPCVRNLRITECYARLSAAARARVGEGANWCSFATWASRQAGCTIRGEDLGDKLAELVKGRWEARRPLLGLWRMLLRRGLFNPNTRLGRMVRWIHSPLDAFGRASAAVAAGNLKVFAEIGREFARYLEGRGVEEMLEGLRPGPPPEGQDWLRRAFRHYEEARTESRAERRAQLMLLANLEIGFHEQTRLQPEIQRAMEAAPDTAADLKRRMPLVGWMYVVLTPLMAPYRRFARAVTRRAISEVLMVLRMPDATLDLGRHLERAAPEVLGRMDEPELMKLVAEVEPANCRNCGAEDWADLRQRMHYIFHLFRAYHADGVVFADPFTAEQTEAIRAGRLPGGRL